MGKKWEKSNCENTEKPATSDSTLDPKIPLFKVSFSGFKLKKNKTSMIIFIKANLNMHK